LDYVFVTHSDSDHYSGILELLEEERLPIGNLVLPAISNPDEAYQTLVALAVEKGCQVYYMKQGDTMELGDVTFRCWNPKPQAYTEKNESSIVLHMNYGSFDALLTGDMDATVEEQLMQEADWEKWNPETWEFLKVAHHGSATASSEAFLQTIHPVIAGISVGQANRYGHPAEEVMERLNRYAGKIYLTKDHGAVTIETNGSIYEVQIYEDNQSGY
jgi:competence protein ComEC